MLERATETATPALPRAAGDTPTRFSRDPSEFRTTTTLLTLIATPTTPAIPATTTTEENL